MTTQRSSSTIDKQRLTSSFPVTRDREFPGLPGAVRAATVVGHDPTLRCKLSTQTALHLRDSLRKPGTETPATPSEAALTMSSGDLAMEDVSSYPAENFLSDREYGGPGVMALACKTLGSCWSFVSERRSSQCTVFSHSDGFLCKEFITPLPFTDRSQGNPWQTPTGQTVL